MKMNEVVGEGHYGIWTSTAEEEVTLATIASVILLLQAHRN
jgi:hypothetical protein